jgi:hypothetical protein
MLGKGPVLTLAIKYSNSKSSFCLHQKRGFRGVSWGQFGGPPN